MLPAAPAQVLLHDAMHDAGIAPLELERHCQGDVALLMKSARVVPELHVIPVDGLSLAVLGQQLGRLEDLGDEHRSLSFGLRRQKMQILPDRAADGAGDSDVVLQSRPSALDGLRDQLCHHGTALDPELAVVERT